MNSPMPTMIALFLLSSCAESDMGMNGLDEKEYAAGKNLYTIELEGATREYIVHVPASYDDNAAVPVVIMLHGAGGSGGGSHNSSGWKEVGEDENFLTVFPTALVYCFTNVLGETVSNTRWVSYPGVADFCSNQTFRDDIRFLREMVVELQQRFQVDAQRIYLAGFSSGGQMGFRSAVELGDLLAAVVQSGGTHQVNDDFMARRNLPIAFELGNQDDRWFLNDAELPMHEFENALATRTAFRRIIFAHARTFDYDTTYVLSGNAATVLTATFAAVPRSNQREFTFSLIEGLDHAYPNTVNHERHGARRNWDWLKQYRRP